MERNGGRWWGAFLFELISKLLQHLGLVDTNASYLLPSSSFILFHPSTSVITGASQFQTACTVRIKSYDRNEHFLPSVGRGASRVRASQVNRASGDRSRSMDTRITMRKVLTHLHEDLHTYQSTCCLDWGGLTRIWNQRGIS
jgi:hypothetical protein